MDFNDSKLVKKCVKAQREATSSHWEKNDTALVLNQHIAIKRLLNDEAFYRQICQMFLDSSIKLKQELTQALVVGDHEQSVKLAHTFKGLAIEIGGEKLAVILGVIEQAARKKNCHVSTKARDAFEHHYQELIIAISAMKTL